MEAELLGKIDSAGATEETVVTAASLLGRIDKAGPTEETVVIVGSVSGKAETTGAAETNGAAETAGVAETAGALLSGVPENAGLEASKEDCAKTAVPNPATRAILLKVCILR